ncbi:MAG: hypothetical protein GQ582_11185, partial [Methyloprofundus sp.]|nr:hypothetical protein [Methyloprofundus sp.]
MLIKHLKVFLLLSLLTLSFSLPASTEEADKKKYASVARVLQDIAAINKQASELTEEDTDNGDKLQVFIQQKRALFKNLLLIIRGSLIDYDVAAISEKDIQLLQSKISINRSRGHSAAVQRDQFSIEWHRTRRDMGSFVVYLVESSRSYQSFDITLKEINRRLKEITHKIEKLPEPIVTAGVVYESIIENRTSLSNIYHLYQDFLEYVKV